MKKDSGLKRLSRTDLVDNNTPLAAQRGSAKGSKCGATLTKGYKNDYFGEKGYFFSDCTLDCAFCSSRVKYHYTSGLGIIIFVRNNCYKELQGQNP